MHAACIVHIVDALLIDDRGWPLHCVLFSLQGNADSLPMEMCSTFDADEIKRLGKRFRKLDLDNSGSLSIDEFMSLPELQQNPLVQRVIDIFDTDGNGEVDFKEFIQGVSQFSVKGDKESKLKCKCDLSLTIESL